MRRPKKSLRLIEKMRTIELRRQKSSLTQPTQSVSQLLTPNTSAFNRLLQHYRHRANDGTRCKVNDGKREVARFLRCDLRQLAVGVDSNSMRFWHYHRGNHALCCGIEKGNAVLAIGGHQ